MHINRLAVIGVGLIGGSLALALRRAGVVGEVVGCGRSRDNLELARTRGIIDRHTSDPRAAVADADMIVIGASLAATDGILRALGEALAPRSVITDVGSTKASVVASARAHLGPALPRFVPGHPIAGTENSGAGAAFASLYEHHRVVLTPLVETDADALAAVRAMWRAAGAEVVEMDVEAHDHALAATSHLPHLLAFNLVDALAAREDAERIFDFAAGGFRDFTRIASSHPAMWADIALANKRALLAASRDFEQRFAALLDALENDDRASLEAIFSRAKQARDHCVVPQSNARSYPDEQC